MKNRVLLIAILLSCFSLSSQQANDCIDAVTVCGNTNISSNVSGFGIQELDRDVNSCNFEEVNSLWLSVEIEVNGSLAFNIRPDDTALEVDYDFYIFGPNNECGNFDNPLRCNTTNPIQAGLTSNLTGLRDNEINTSGGPGSDGNGFVSSINATAGEQYYILVDRPIGNGGFSLEWTGSAGFLQSPIVNEPGALLVCPNEQNTIIDLTQQESSITTSDTAVSTYYTNYENAFDQENEILNPTQYDYSNNNEIFVRVTNRNSCFEIVNFNIRPIAFPSLPNFDYKLCDSDRNGTEEFDISKIKSDLENSINNMSGFIVSLHPTETAAVNDTNTITNTMFTSEDGEIFARIVSTTLDAECISLHPISLTVIADLYPATVNLVQCDVDEENSTDGITNINLSQTFEDVTGISGVQIFYYSSVEDRNLDSPIANPQNYSNLTAFNETIYYKIISELCESVGEISIQINPTTTSLNTLNSVYTCDDDRTDGVIESTFDLEDIRQNGYPGLEIAFYQSLNDVTLEQNQLQGNFRTSSTLIYARLENNNECQGVDEIELIVHELPEVLLESSYKLCYNDDPITIEAPSGFDAYTLIKVSGGQELLMMTGQQLTIHEEGNYRLEVEKHHEYNSGVLSCIGTTDFIVELSSKAIFQDIIIDESISSGALEIVVTGEGDYEFSIDGEEYQDSPRFENIKGGFYTVFARDKFGCGISVKEISILGFPKFFTPNGDGANDTWQIIGSTAFEAQAIHIYDRYGKLVKQLSTDSNGWDGYMNGRPLPASDYWFKFTLRNGKEFKGHFALKR